MNELLQAISLYSSWAKVGMLISIFMFLFFLTFGRGIEDKNEGNSSNSNGIPKQNANGNNNTQIINIPSFFKEDAKLKVIETLELDSSTVEFKFLNEGDISAFITKIIFHLEFDGYGPTMILGHERAYEYYISVLHPKEDETLRRERAEKGLSPDEYDNFQKQKPIVLAKLSGTNEVNSRLEIPISQSVAGRGVDRILLEFASSANPKPTYKVRAEFIFNGNKSVMSDTFEICL